MDATIILLWVVVLLILHLLIEKSLQMKTIAETFMNTDPEHFRTFSSLKDEHNYRYGPEEKAEPEGESGLEDQLVNFLMNGDSMGEQNKEERAYHELPASGQFELKDHTNLVKETKKDALTSGRFANLHTYDSLGETENYSSPM